MKITIETAQGEKEINLNPNIPVWCVIECILTYFDYDFGGDFQLLKRHESKAKLLLNHLTLKEQGIIDGDKLMMSEYGNGV